MNGTRRRDLALAPLAQVFDRCLRREDPASVPLLGPRFAAILAARSDLASTSYLHTAADADFLAAVQRFYDAVVAPPLHGAVIERRAGLIRFAIDHLHHGADRIAARLDSILAAGGPYHIGGLGPSFWSALCQARDPQTMPAWLPLTVAGLQRLGLLAADPVTPGVFYARLIQAYARLRGPRPHWSALDCDFFLACVAALRGRDLDAAAAQLEWYQPDTRIRAVLTEVRSQISLRRRLREQGARFEQARRQLETGLHDGHAGKVRAALALVDPAVALPGAEDVNDDLVVEVGRCWEADAPEELLDGTASASRLTAGDGLLPAVLHLRDPARFAPWNDVQRRGYGRLDETINALPSAAEQYRHYCQGLLHLRQRYAIHPYEVPAVLAALAVEPAPPPRGDMFCGFGTDSFRFLAELAVNNDRDWMRGQRERYLFAVRRPLLELCGALAERYVRPVLEQIHGWHLETGTATSRCFSSICQNNYGRSRPYETALGFAFYRPEMGSKRADVQLFVRLDAAGLSFGMHLGRRARAVGEQFRRNLARHAEALFAALAQRDVLGQCHFSDVTLHSVEELRQWSNGKALTIARRLPAEAPLMREDGLVGEIMLTFERLLPAFACAVADDPRPWLQAGQARLSCYSEAEFQRDTYLSGEWLRRARTLLELKRQLILHGVPGTGKTHVARCLARLLSGGRADTVRLVQFHPGYSYEEFVEGIKAKSVEINGRHEVTYPVESGLLCRFAAEAARNPTAAHVLIIDEINRGNLPRIFGELLFLLEYREQAVGLPYSRQSFRLPANLFLVGTMNGADRSVALIDQALRRRFSFLDMCPDPRILAAWLEIHPPKAGPDFAQTVVALFEGVNLRLRNDLGPQQQIGHSYFMVPDLDEERLGAVWDNHVRPLLADYFAAQPARLADYELGRLMAKRKREKARAPEA